MSLNFEKMKALLDKNKAAKKTEKKFDPKDWRPTDGTHLLRMLPAPDGEPIKELLVHYGLGSSFLCPKMFGENCPSCDFAWSIYDRDNKEDKTFKRFLPNNEFVACVVKRDADPEEDEFGPDQALLWRFNNTIKEELIETFCDEDFGDITDPSAGNDIVFSYDAELAKNRQRATKIKVKPGKTKLASSKKEIDDILEGYIDPLLKHPRKSTDEVAAILSAHFEKMENQTTDAPTKEYGSNKSDDDSSKDQSDAGMSFEELRKRLKGE